jgi:ATP-dependent helicase/nuclease subunit A
MSIVDSSARARALDPTLSFCVTAPAGSGKTELLIQRYLTLLARVDTPEQVLAITFTRKAAAEMRERVLQSLQDAEQGTVCSSPHQQITRQLAESVLATSSDRSWSLVKNSVRLNIKTIDAFCGSLTRQMPVLSQFGGHANVTDDALELYGEAVSDLFQSVGQEGGVSEDIKALMLHFDNNWAKLSDLFVAMLGRREQWGSYVGVHHQADEAQQYLIATVQTLVDEALKSVSDKLSGYSSELLRAVNYAAGNLDEPQLDVFPTANYSEFSAWQRIRQLLLTAAKEGKWRSRLDKNMGFPAGKGEATEAKDRLKLIIENLSDIDGLLEELAAISYLPAIESNSESWRLVLHLSRVLPTLSALLLLVFQRRGVVDHTQVALSALQALGEDDRPTDLALRLDYQLQHILMDEFQDTAINQYDLVSRLTRGWGEHNSVNLKNPRSLMIVGDGMQSIYGFRNANVGLFLRARQEGFNGVLLEPLSLQSNFRSDPKVVDWVNETFVHAFPARDNIAKSQVSYTHSSAVQPTQPDACVALHSFQGDHAAAQEVDYICIQIQEGVTDSRCQSIAVLARTRGHLKAILDRLKQLGIGYSAPDIDSLASSAVVMDLMSLCRALLNPADSLAWAAILRAPWCGLSLADLHAIACATTRGFSGLEPWSQLLSIETADTLSDDGRLRLLAFTAAITRAHHNRDRLALRIWIEHLWLDLGGPEAVENAVQLEDAERFFQLLEEAEQEGQGLNVPWLESRLQRLFVNSQDPASKVQLMTLHKAKGLEFDWVIIPSLQKITRSNSKPLLNWDDYTSASGQRGFLLAANDHSKVGEPSLYNYLELQRANKSLEETTRLLYVGVTRAVSRLYMTACLNYIEEKNEYRPPSSRSLLGRIWPQFADQMCSHPALELQSTTDPSADIDVRTIRRHSSSLLCKQPVVAAISSELASDPNTPLRSLNYVDRYVGTVVHLALERYANSDVIATHYTDLDKQRWRFELRRLGLANAALEQAQRQVESSIMTVLQDDVGRWLLSSEHDQARSEFTLTYVDNSVTAKHLIVDRTFIDTKTGIRWLIDYKNSTPDNGEPQESFFKREATQYSAQVLQYKDALREISDHPINCALYFTALGHLEVLSSISDGPATV